MLEKSTILAIHVHQDNGIEIEIALEKAGMNPITFIGILEQVKHNLLSGTSQTDPDIDKVIPKGDA
jgi:hypothetical protein